ncbi:MAG: hypothetical protein HYY17_11945 [Planctomycetes bacterium]|nr:hypothetical protein [Planctomycetota bacterium]
MFERWRKWWVARTSPPPRRRVSTTKEGIRLWSDDRPCGEVRFSDVKQIFAFKRDLWAVDLIGLGFRVAEDGAYCEVDEEMRGFDELLFFLERAFGIMQESWWEKVAVPAFETNFTTLWGKEHSGRFLRRP